MPGLHELNEAAQDRTRRPRQADQNDLPRGARIKTEHDFVRPVAAWPWLIKRPGSNPTYAFEPCLVALRMSRLGERPSTRLRTKWLQETGLHATTTFKQLVENRGVNGSVGAHVNPGVLVAFHPSKVAQVWRRGRIDPRSRRNRYAVAARTRTTNFP